MNITVNALPDWGARAACRDEGDPEIFFPVGDRDSMTPLALSICSGCPVKSDCLTFALNEGHTEGIWGGLTSEQRRRLRQRRLWEVADVS